jgi:glycosyltransferase involved in cell wall biosynthesis
MKVLHTPSDIASIPSHTVRGLRQIGVEAHGLIHGIAPSQSSEGLAVIQPYPRRQFIPYLVNRLRWVAAFTRAALDADIVHWYYCFTTLPRGLDLRLFRALRKPCLVEWLGSDIRIPDVEFADNPYYTAAYAQGYEYRDFESLENSRRRQQQFARAGFACAAVIGMDQYVQRDIFPKVYSVPARIMAADYAPHYPNSSNATPLVVHGPTAPIAKGTAAVLKAVETLREKYTFEFRLVQGVTRQESLEIMRQADIFVDQFVLGDRGMASLEAMAWGKPVVGYLKPSLAARYPPDLPLVNATQDTLADVLAALLSSGQRRHELGQQGRAYIEKYCDAVNVAPQLAALYQGVIRDRRQLPNKS